MPRICVKWNEILEDFSKEVNEKRYRKIDYLIWKEIKKGETATLNYSSLYKQITVHIQNNSNLWWETSTWNIGDGSLGEYLYEEYFKENRLDVKPPNYTTESITLNSTTGELVCKYDSPKTTISTIEDLVHKYDDYFKDITIDNITTKEEKKMFNFDFGKVNGNQVHMSVYGMAVKNAEGNWVSYDANTHSMMNVDIINFNAENFMYKVPVAISAVETGDVVVHNKRPCFVTAVNDERNNLVVVDIMSGEEKVILPVRSPFGFNFIVKVVSFIDFAGSADEKNPFGNMWMLMMMDGNKDFKDVLPLMMLSGNGGFDTSNPMAMYAIMTMMDGKGNDNLLPLMFMMGGNK